MAYIKFITSDEIEHLHTPNVFGRKNIAANTSVDSHLVSRNHASIEWQNEHWCIQDFSRNGTWVNGVQLESHMPKKLEINDLIKLGSNDDNGITFTICNLDAPRDIIFRPHPSLQTVSIIESNLIPTPSSPDFGLYYCHDRKNWFSQPFNIENNSIDNHEKGPHQHGDEIQCAGNRWTLFLLNQDSASTPVRKKSKINISSIEFRILFNRTEDNIQITLISRDDEKELDQQRYNPILAHLINLQQKSDDGWVKFHDLSNACGKNFANINLQLFLLRHHLTSILPQCKGLSTIIERKGETLRLGIKNYSIYRNGKLDQSSDFHF